ncbi:MAG: sensor histidine kinase [Candidatus Cryptobacteroides sp.]|nr:ATP-binding protein [Bacteroidales bacterium]
MKIQNKHRSLSQRLLTVVAMMLILFTAGFAIFQFRREKQYRINLLDTRLQDINKDIAKAACASDTAAILNLAEEEGVRVTILDLEGKVLYDSSIDSVSDIPDHSGRAEVSSAISSGKGYSIKRESETLGGTWFYSATAFRDSGLIVRTSHIYDVTLSKTLASDKSYIWLAFMMAGIMFFLFYRYIRHIDLNIKQLKSFAEMAAAGGDVSGADMVFTDDELGDISATVVRLYAKLQNSEDDKTRLKRQLTQNVAHELRTPASSIQGYIETILENPDMEGKERDEFLERCHAQCERLGSLITDITLLSKIDEASGSFNAEDIDISEIMNDIKSDVESRLKERNMKMLVLISPGTVIRGSRQLVYSIFRNLTDNALAYAGDGATITVQCRHSDSRYHHFIFNDNGEGVPAEHLPHLFERFYRVDKGRSRKLGGTGLGLAIVKNAVLLHGGRISVRNGESGGLEFAFTLARSTKDN